MTPIEQLIETVEFKEVEKNGSNNSEGLPYVTHEGTLDINGIKINVVQLNTGQRIIPQEEFEKIFPKEELEQVVESIFKKKQAKKKQSKTEKIKISVYCGISVQNNCVDEHPLLDVQKAIELIDRKQSTYTYTNSPDKVLTLKHYGEEKGIELEFFLDGVSLGNNIEPIFADFNKAHDLLISIMK
jgi:hypothetical protein